MTVSQLLGEWICNYLDIQLCETVKVCFIFSTITYIIFRSEYVYSKKGIYFYSRVTSLVNKNVLICLLIHKRRDHFSQLEFHLSYGRKRFLHMFGHNEESIHSVTFNVSCHVLWQSSHLIIREKTLSLCFPKGNLA